MVNHPSGSHQHYYYYYHYVYLHAFSALTLLVGRQEGHLEVQTCIWPS